MVLTDTPKVAAARPWVIPLSTAATTRSRRSIEYARMRSAIPTKQPAHRCQVTAFRAKPGLAAVPGTSNHGWALAVDLCGGINVAGTAQSAWMAANSGRFGFVQPDWARQGGEKPEPWHWEFGHLA